jgi:hypothetical protein
MTTTSSAQMKSEKIVHTAISSPPAINVAAVETEVGVRKIGAGMRKIGADWRKAGSHHDR